MQHATSTLGRRRAAGAVAAFLVSLLPCSRGAVADAAVSAYPPGQYELSWQTVMPHLEAMRHVTDRETRCLDGDPAALFPVLRQPALRGCALEPAPGDRWRLACRSTAVASGSATLAVAGATVSGDLAIKMGGKNMTFSQHVTAVRRGSCRAR